VTIELTKAQQKKIEDALTTIGGIALKGVPDGSSYTFHSNEVKKVLTSLVCESLEYDPTTRRSFL
jgi:hypothetical protein